MTPELFMSTLQGTVPSTMELSWGYTDGGIRIIMKPVSNHALDYICLHVWFRGGDFTWDLSVSSTTSSMFCGSPETPEEFLDLVPYVEAFQRTAALAKELLYNFPDPESRHALFRHILTWVSSKH